MAFTAPNTRSIASVICSLILLLGVSVAQPSNTTSTLTPAVPNATSILSVANGAGLKQLVAAIKAAGGPLLAAVRNSSTSVTVFAPTDEAFKAAFQALNITNVTDLAATGLLQSILKFHIVPQPIPSVAATRWQPPVKVPTLLKGQSLELIVKKGSSKTKETDEERIKNATLFVKGYKTTAQVLIPDVPAGLSIVHVIDKVLVPKLIKNNTN